MCVYLHAGIGCVLSHSEGSVYLCWYTLCIEPQVCVGVCVLVQAVHWVTGVCVCVLVQAVH